MLDAAVKALSQILSPPMRSILWRSIALALVLITVLAIGLQRLLTWFAEYGEGWAEAMLGPGFHTPLNVLAWIVSIAAGLGIVLGGIFFMPAITSLVPSVFVAAVADHGKREPYPGGRSPRWTPAWSSTTSPTMSSVNIIRRSAPALRCPSASPSPRASRPRC